MSNLSAAFWRPSVVFASSILLRVILLFYGLFQDKYSALPYTDIDYYVFTDAARYVSFGQSPYLRETYRYTPLLAWILVPTAGSGVAWFSFGKVTFAVADIVAGWLTFLVLRSTSGGRMSTVTAMKYASIWLLNPTVATISTRGSSEGLLGVMVVAVIWAVLNRYVVLAGALLGLAVHFKIYPFIYGISIIWYLEADRIENSNDLSAGDIHVSTIWRKSRAFFTPDRITFLLSSLATFAALNYLMYTVYGEPFIVHTYLYHLKRIDHRHNFSPYNTLLHLVSAIPRSPPGSLRFESLAFVPQLFLSAIFIPFALAKKDLAGTMLVQTFAFVTFNKVCTSQYFLWYIVLLPFYLPYSSFLASPRLGVAAAALWVVTQGLWLYQAYLLEFLGQSTFMPGLFLAGLAFFAVNCWILGIVVNDVGGRKKATAKDHAD